MLGPGGLSVICQNREKGGYVRDGDAMSQGWEIGWYILGSVGWVLYIRTCRFECWGRGGMLCVRAGRVGRNMLGRGIGCYMLGSGGWVLCQRWEIRVLYIRTEGEGVLCVWAGKVGEIYQGGGGAMCYGRGVGCYILGLGDWVLYVGAGSLVVYVRAGRVGRYF